MSKRLLPKDGIVYVVLTGYGPVQGDDPLIGDMCPDGWLPYFIDRAEAEQVARGAQILEMRVV